LFQAKEADPFAEAVKLSSTMKKPPPGVAFFVSAAERRLFHFWMTKMIKKAKQAKLVAVTILSVIGDCAKCIAAYHAHGTVPLLTIAYLTLHILSAMSLLRRQRKNKRKSQIDRKGQAHASTNKTLK